MRVKIYMTIDIDPEEYPIPADEDVGLEIEGRRGVKQSHDTLIILLSIWSLSMIISFLIH